MNPSVQYAKTNDGVNIAYAVYGTGPVVVFTSNTWGSLHGAQSNTVMPFAPINYLTASGRSVVLYDIRGAGSSDRDITDFSLEARVLDVEAVVETLALDRFPLIGMVQGSLTAIAYAAARPEKVSHLILVNPFALGESYYEAIPAMRATKAMKELAEDEWELFTLSLATWVYGVADADFTRSVAAGFRASMTPHDFLRFRDASERLGVRDLLAQVQVPTLAIKDDSIFASKDLVRAVAAGIPGAHFVTTNDVAAAIGEFLGIAQPSASMGPPVRSGGFVTVLFTDVEGSTALTERLGDARSRELLREHERNVRDALKSHGGSEVKTMGDGFMASFSSATKALECAVAMQQVFAAHNEVAPEPIRVRVGLNAGEPIAEEEDLYGTAVNMAARIAAMAGGGQILVSDVVRQLVGGQRLSFRGSR